MSPAGPGASSFSSAGGSWSTSLQVGAGSGARPGVRGEGWVGPASPRPPHTAARPRIARINSKQPQEADWAPHSDRGRPARCFSLVKCRLRQSLKAGRLRHARPALAVTLPGDLSAQGQRSRHNNSTSNTKMRRASATAEGSRIDRQLPSAICGPLCFEGRAPRWHGHRIGRYGNRLERLLLAVCVKHTRDRWTLAARGARTLGSMLWPLN